MVSPAPFVNVIVVGAGLSGLRAATEIHDAGLSYVVLEAMDRVDGKTLSRSEGLSIAQDDKGRMSLIPYGMPANALLSVEPDEKLAGKLKPETVKLSSAVKSII
ncbi:hypothetical protein NHJ13051_005043 [Beauveria bassiana]